MLICHQFREEACVKQMQNRVFNPANVLVGLTPILCRVWFHHALFKFGRHITELIPTRLVKCIHRIGFAACRFAAIGASGFVKFGHFCQWRTRTIRNHIFRQHDWQILFRNRYITAIFAMNNRNRTAPITLARNTPITQTVLRFGFSRVQTLQFVADCVKGCLKI